MGNMLARGSGFCGRGFCGRGLSGRGRREMQCHLCSCKFIWVFVPHAGGMDAILKIHLRSMHYRAMVNATCSAEPTDPSQPKPEATEHVPAGEKSCESRILSLGSSCGAPINCDNSQQSCSQSSAVSLAESTAEGIPPDLKKESHFLRGCLFFTHQKLNHATQKACGEQNARLRKPGTALRGRKGQRK